jgi:lipopolysaccharide transport system permease protein
MVIGLFKNTALIMSMARRDVVGRYKGSVLGLLWSLFNPLFMLAVYTFAFGFIFKSRWPGLADDPFSFALTLFPALLVFNYIAECVTRAPGLIIGNPSYVKKVVFPLEILPVIVAISALFHFFVGFVVWCIVSIFAQGSLHFTALLIPFIIMPLVLFALGWGWILASLGVYLRDVQQIMGVVMSALIFMSPIFYAIESVPEQYRHIVLMNPITSFVTMTRSAMVFGQIPSFGYWFNALLGSGVFALFGAWWFAATRKGFADVL